MSDVFLVGCIAVLLIMLVAIENENIKTWFSKEYRRLLGIDSIAKKVPASRPFTPPQPRDTVAEEHSYHLEESPEPLDPWFVPEWGGKCYEDYVFDVFLISAQGDTVRLPEFKEISLPREGVVILDRALCYSFSGQQVYNAQRAAKPFKFFTSFHEGMALISDSKATRFGFFRHADFCVSIPLQYLDGRDFHDGVALVRRDEQWGFVNKTGIFQSLPPDADKLSNLPPLDFRIRRSANEFPPCPARNFREGLGAVISKGRWGYIDKNGRWIIPARYDWAGSFGEGLAAVRLGTNCFYIDSEGKTVIPGPFACARRFSDGFAPVRIDGPLWSLIDRFGKIVVSNSWLTVDSCADGVVPFTVEVRRREVPRGGIFNIATGESRVFDRICHIRTFSEGLGVAEWGRSFGLIDRQGKQVGSEPFPWSKASSICEGMALVETQHM
ncbi:MAG: WG repeat-containing protein [Candidatus Riflebacteria bacterium]|nr:WG repeat-containing protein [Candidatus Riflebacteria bacterium]